MLEITTLGGLSLRNDGQAITDLGSRHAEALLVYLAVEAGRHPRQLLATLLWPESSDSLALASLRGVLSILKKSVGAYLAIDRDAVGLRPDGELTLDLCDLDRRLATGRPAEALALYRGEFLQGFHLRNSVEFEEWRRREEERVRRRVIDVLHVSISAAIDSGTPGAGRELVARLLELDPLDELAHQQAIVLLALAGQRPAALAQYDRCRRLLAAELGVEPSAETEELYGQILRGERPTGVGPAPPRHNLPAPQTRFVGREQELAQIRAWVTDPVHRLLTLVGPGGIGKTRLALQAASGMLRSFADGTYFVPLAAVSTPDYLVPAIATALQFSVDTLASPLDPQDQLLDYLRPRSVLLVVDSLEHLVSGAALLSQILAHAPQVRLLVTSQQRLNLQGEWAFPVRGLPVPAEPAAPTAGDSGAVALFVERARQRQPDFEPDDVELEQIIRICRLVEGSPLAIELAAAWIPLLSPAEIAAELVQNPDLIVAPLHDLPEKHHSLRAVFDGSWQLLSEEQQEALCRLAVFGGPFDRRAALQVAGAGLSQLSALLDRSWLIRDDAGYFHMHALLRRYATEKLDRLPTLRDRVLDDHCRYYTGYLLERKTDLMGPRMIVAREEVRREMENVREAAEWAVRHWDVEAAREVLTGLLALYAVHGWHEGAVTFRDLADARIASLPTGDPSAALQDPVYLCARVHQAFLQTNLGQIDASEAISRECLQPLTALQLAAERSECVHNLGVNASFRGEYESACELLEAAILLGRQSDHILWPTFLLWLGHAHFLLGEYESGLLSLKKCYDLFDRRGSRWGAGFALSKMGLAADGLGDYAQAMDYHRRALAIFEESGDQAGQGYALSRLSSSAYWLHDYRQAARLAQAGYDRCQAIGHRWGISTSLCRLGFARIGLDDLAGARRSFTDALHEARAGLLAPLSLFAVAGLACVMAQEGDKEKAGELYRFVRHHPQMPAPYLETAARWLAHLDKPVSEPASSSTQTGGEADALDEIVTRLLADQGSPL